MKKLQKDKYGLYINAENYAECKSNIIISEIKKEIDKKIERETNVFFKLKETRNKLTGLFSLTS